MKQTRSVLCLLVFLASWPFVTPAAEEAMGENIPKDLATIDKWYRNAIERECAVLDGIGPRVVGVNGAAVGSSGGFHREIRMGGGEQRNNTFTGLPSGNENATSKGQTRPATVAEQAVAFKAFRKAADEGNARGQLNLGLCYATGKGIRRDSFEAMKWFQKSALQWERTAQFYLALCYAAGEGTQKDEVEALVWMNISATCGEKDATEWRILLEACLGSDNTIMAQKRSESLRKTMKEKEHAFESREH